VKTVAIVPVKGLGLAKSRLGGLLTAEERSLLVLDMLAHVLDALRESGAVDEVAHRPRNCRCRRAYTP
jgi:2-phospho-L-lactate guanylyltransferase (CobY/MobA/RfbA family)